MEDFSAVAEAWASRKMGGERTIVRRKNKERKTNS